MKGNIFFKRKDDELILFDKSPVAKVSDPFVGKFCEFLNMLYVEASFMIESRLSHESRLIHDDESRLSRLIQSVLMITKMMTKNLRK